MQSQQTFGRGGLNGFLDVDELVDRIGSSTRTKSRGEKEFIGFDGDDERRLSALETVGPGKRRGDRRRLLRERVALRADPSDRRPVAEDVDALKQTQQAYLVSLAAGSTTGSSS